MNATYIVTSYVVIDDLLAIMNHTDDRRATLSLVHIGRGHDDGGAAPVQPGQHPPPFHRRPRAHPRRAIVKPKETTDHADSTDYSL